MIKVVIIASIWVLTIKQQSWDSVEVKQNKKIKSLCNKTIKWNIRHEEIKNETQWNI